MPEKTQVLNANEEIKTSTPTKQGRQSSKNKHSRSPYKTQEGKQPLIQAKQRPVNKSHPRPRTIDPFEMKSNPALEGYHQKADVNYELSADSSEPVQRQTSELAQKTAQGSTQFQQIATDMGEQHGVDTSVLKATHNSSFPATVNAEATIQGNKIDFAPDKDTEHNIKHEVGHFIDNTKNGTPQGNQVVNGQKVDTTRENVVDQMANQPIQKKNSNPDKNYSSDTVQTKGPIQQVEDSNQVDKELTGIITQLENLAINAKSTEGKVTGLEDLNAKMGQLKRIANDPDKNVRLQLLSMLKSKIPGGKVSEIGKNGASQTTQAPVQTQSITQRQTAPIQRLGGLAIGAIVTGVVLLAGGIAYYLRNRSKDLTNEGYKLHLANRTFETEALQVWGYIKSKGLQARYEGRTIHLIKTPGKEDKVCHHWAFGGLQNNFNQNIQEIRMETLGDVMWDYEMETPNGLTNLGPTTNTDIRIYDDGDHSARKHNGEWFHKFNQYTCIFAVEGMNDNLSYNQRTDINIPVLNPSGLGSASHFTYEAIEVEPEQQHLI